MILYIPTKMLLSDPELGPYQTYGIRVLELTADSCAEKAFIPDVSPDETITAHICYLSTKHQLSPLHLADVIDDFL